jgi:hypothetical protein
VLVFVLFSKLAHHQVVSTGGQVVRQDGDERSGGLGQVFPGDLGWKVESVADDMEGVAIVVHRSVRVHMDVSASCNHFTREDGERNFSHVICEIPELEII